MADTEEEIEELCRDLIVVEKCSFGTLRKRISQHYNDVTLSSDDISSIKQTFIAVVLRKWHDECEASIEARVSELKNDKDKLLKLINDFTSQSDIDNAPDLIKTEYFKIIEADRDLFSEEVLMKSYNKVFNFAKLKIKHIQDDFRNENDFLEVLIDVIKNSDRQFENFVEALKLLEFVNKKLEFKDVLRNIIENNFSFDSYEKLQKLSLNLLESSDLTLVKTIRNEIRSYVVMERKIIEEDERKILLLMRKIIFLDDIEIISHDVKDIRVVCDIFHFCGENKFYKYPVDNLIIIANLIKVHEQITIDMSGRSAEPVTGFISSIAKSFRQRDGKDGNAGESGGNIAIACEKIINGDLLTLISNGGNASYGENGQDGMDGKNGKNVEKINMTAFGEKFDISTYNTKANWLDDHIKRVKNTGERSGPVVPLTKDGRVPKNAYERGIYTFIDGKPVRLDYFEENWYEHDGFSRSYCIEWNYGALLVRGKSGSQGTEGGLGGLGGEGGFAGKIDLEINDDQGKPVKIFASNGSNGINGLGGYNGINGVDGRDAWTFDNRKWTHPKYFGLDFNEKNKYEVSEVDKDDEFAVWSPWHNIYKAIKLKSTIKQSTSVKQRNKSATIRSRASHAKTARKKATFHSGVKNQYSEYLNEAFLKDDFLNEELDLTLDMTKTTTKSKVKTKVKQTFNDEILRNNLKVEEVILTFDEIKEILFQNEVKFSTFSEILRNNTLNLDDWLELRRSYWEFIETLTQPDDAMEISDSDCLFLVDALKIENPSEYLLDSKQVLRLINEKIILAEISKEFLMQTHDDPVIFLPQDIESKIPYLVDKNYFNENITCVNSLNGLGIDFATLNHYFNSDNEENRRQIRALFTKLKEIYLGSRTSLKKAKDAIIRIIDESKKIDKKHLDEFFNETSIILHKHKNEIKDLENILEQFSETSESVKKLFENEEVAKFIERNLVEEGIRSPIYRKILSFLFEISFRIFVRNIDGQLCVTEECLNEGCKVMDLIMEKGKFHELKFDEKRYKRFKLKIHEAKAFNDKIPSFDNIDVKTQELSQKKENLQSLEHPTDEDRKEMEKIINEIQNNQKLLQKIDFLKFLKLNLDSNVLVDFILSFFNKFFIQHELKSALQELPAKIILSIAVHLFYEKTSITIQEFSSIIFSVLESPKLFDYFAVKFLTNEQSKWIIEIILLQIENYLNESFDTKVFRDNLNSLSYHPILFLFLTKLEQLKDNEMTLNDFEKVLKNMRHFSNLTFSHLLTIQELNSWQHVITSEYWIEKFSFLSDAESPVVNELQSKFDAESLERLLTIMASKGENLGKVDIVDFLKNFNTGEWIFSDEQFDILEDNDPEKWVEEINKIYTSEGQRSVEQIVNLVKENKDTSESICMNIENVADATNDVLMEEISSNCSNYRLRNTQIVSIFAFYQSQKGALLQVGTGEGKTFVGATFALLKVLNGEKIHIVTSSSVLAERDANDPEIKRIFRNFGVFIGHNCHDDIDVRRRTYMECGVVYGTLGNFQRDHLLTVFYDKNILPAEYLQNVLVDEVDSILLDKGNNILYLSKELPDVDELESAFMFIWQWVNQETDDEQYLDFILKSENIRQAFLDNFYGVVFESDIKVMTGEDPKDLVEYLKAEEIINDEGTILVQDFTLESLNISDDLKSKISYYIKKKIESPKVVKIPKFYHSFVMRYLDRWIKSALNAVLMQEGVQYVIDKVSGGSTVQSDPNIVILDVDTGTDQKNSEWDEALCQFLQLKHGCRLSELSLKSVFISNVSYFKLYKMKYGMTGTLGSKDERDKLNKFYDLEYATIPSYLPKKFTEYDAILTKSNTEWLSQIVNETSTMIGEGRSVLIICNTIKNIDSVENAFFSAGKDFFNDKNLKTYKRDYEEFNIGFLLPKKVIIATNLAGRGTDIRLSEELARNGGLHVVLTYLAPNVRVENQAFGRAARAGAKGSARMIILHKTSQVVKDLKHERDQQELIRLEEVSNFYQKFITVEEKFFKEFLDAYKKFSADLEEVDKELKEIFLENVKVLWSLWLDENSERLNNFDRHKAEVEESFKNFIENSTKIDPLDAELHPTLRLEVFKHFYKSNDFESASKILNGDCEGLLGFEYNKILLRFDFDSSLNENQVKKIRRTIKKFNAFDNDRNDRVNLVKIIKEKYRCTLRPLNGYENQLKELNEVNQIFIESLHSILGTGITPESFNCSPFSNFLYKEGFYEFLTKNGYIEKPTVDDFIDASNLEEISKKYQVDSTKLFNFLSQKSSQTVESFNDFANELREVLEFPSLEDFWEILCVENLLINQVEYALIDLETLHDFSPFLKEECHKKFDKLQIELKTFTNCEIFMTNICEDIKKVDTSKVLAIVYNHEVKSDELFQELVRNDLVEFNKKAIFNFNCYEEIKSSLKFDKFDSIDERNFDFIEHAEIRCQVVERLKEQNILNLDLSLNYENLSHLNLEENFIYEMQVEEVLRSNFMYRIVLENLLEKMRENSLNISINLYANPHMMMVHDLIENFIIQPSKVDSDKLEELEYEEILSEFVDKNFLIDFLQKGFNANLALPKNLNFEALVRDLIESKVLLELKEENLNEYQEHTKESIKSIKDRLCDLSFAPLVVFKLDNEMSSRFKHVEESVKLMLRRRDEIAANKSVIVKILQDAVPKFDTFESPVPVLIPVENLSNSLNPDAIECMKLKGLDCVIGVQEEKFTHHFWLNMLIIMLTTLIQTALAIKFFMLKKYSDSVFLFFQAMQDIIFILNSLKLGTFSWKDHARFKTSNLIFRNIYATSIIQLFKTFRRKQRQDKSYKLKPKEVSHQSEIISTKALLKVNKLNLVRSTINATTTAEMSQRLDYIVINAVESLAMKIKKIWTGSFYDKFINHELNQKTIERLLKRKSEEKSEELIISTFTKIHQEKDYFKMFTRALTDKVLESLKINLQTFDGETQIQNISFDEALTGTPTTILNQIIAVFLNDLNSSLSDEIDGKSLSEIHNSDEFKKYIQLEMGDMMWKRLNENINCNVKLPALKLAANKADLLIAREFSSQVKENRQKKNFSRDAIAKNLESIKLEAPTVDDDLQDNFIKKAIKIRKTAKNLETIASLSTLKIPMEIIELEAAARVLKVKLLIQLSDIVHEFGDEGCKVVRIDVKDGHFTIDNHSRPIITYETIFASLKSKINMEEFTIIKFKNEVVKKLTQNDMKVIYDERRKKFSRQIGFYGIKECYNLSTLTGSKRFANFKFFVKIKTFNGLKVESYLLKPNQDLRSFDKNDDAKTVDTHKTFNKLRADAVALTLEKINEICQKRFFTKLELEDFAVSKAIPILALRRDFVYMPVEIKTYKRKEKFSVKISFDLQNGDQNEPEIPRVTAELTYNDYEKNSNVIFFKTLIPAMSKKADTDVLPIENSPIVVLRSDFTTGNDFIDLVKIFNKKYSDIKLVTAIDDDENLPDKKNGDYMTKYPYEFGKLDDNDYYTREIREKCLDSNHKSKWSSKNKKR